MNQLSTLSIALIIGGYFAILMLISYFTSRGSSNKTFFTADKSSAWPLVAFGMIGATLSGVTFMSIPGVVGADGYNQAFSYMQMVFGYLLGYAVIALVLLPLYYRLGLTSIYEYLRDRFGNNSYRTGAFYFLLSRVIGASLRLFLVAIVLQKFLMDPWGIPFFITVLITIGLIWLYTYSGGIKTIVITDTLQTICMLGAVAMTIYYICQGLNIGLGDIPQTIRDNGLGKMWFFDTGWNDANNFWKQFISGALITIVMTGLDQDMMQKNLTCRSIGDAQKNMFSFSFILIFANILFLSLGALLYIYANQNGIAIPEKTDQLFPTLALQHLPSVVGIAFLLGLIAAAYSSADSALTSLTTAFCIDFLGFKTGDRTEEEMTRTRFKVHIGFSILLFLVVVLVEMLDAGAIINELFKLAGYTYGPLLGLFTFGIFTKRSIQDKYVIPISILSPILSYLMVKYSDVLLGGFQFGSTIIALNGLITFLGLLAISKKEV